MERLIEVEIIPIGGRLSGKRGKQFMELTDKLEPFWNRKIALSPRHYYYSFPEDCDLLNDLVTFAKEESKCIELKLYRQGRAIQV